MKLKFSGNQKMPLYLIIGATAIGVPLVLFIFIAAKERIGIAHILFLIVLTLPCVFMTARFSFVLNTIVLDKTGIRVENKRGKVKRALRWCDIRIFTQTQYEQNGEKYICLSSNAGLPVTRTTFGGVVWTIYYDKNTVVLLSDGITVAYCKAHMQEYGMELRQVTNPHTGK